MPGTETSHEMFDPDRALKKDIGMVRNVICLGLVSLLLCGGGAWLVQNCGKAFW